jgi:hypothetical protein
VNILRGWLLALALLASTASHAALRLTLEAGALDEGQRQASQQLLDEAVAALPPRLRQRTGTRSTAVLAASPASS